MALEIPEFYPTRLVSERRSGTMDSMYRQCGFNLDDPSMFSDWEANVHKPPALLPDGSINFPAEPLDVPRSGGMHIPVMNPKLVNTLKYMISPSPSSSDCSGGTGGMSDCSGDERRNGDTRRCNKRKNEVLHQSSMLSDVCRVSSTPSDQYYGNYARREVEEDEDATLVSVELIQNRRPFKCGFPQCNKTFKNPQTMKMHKKTHYSEDSGCHVEGNNNANGLSSSNKAGHNKKIPSRCPVCRRSFVGLYELRRHYGRKHNNGEKKFGCKKCAKKFYIEVDLRDHEKLCGEPIECKCGMKFAFKCNLVAHKKGHPACQDPQPVGGEVLNKKNSSTSQKRQRARSQTSNVPLVLTTGSPAVNSSNLSPQLPALTNVANDVDWSPSSVGSDDYVPGLPDLMAGLEDEWGSKPLWTQYAYAQYGLIAQGLV